ncbi:MAG: CorA family divalent cation transporter [Oscillospiraceae bacterium]|nr:CorA family divalent cation transporter [Oscillospiraceae bacterium]
MRTGGIQLKYYQIGDRLTGGDTRPSGAQPYIELCAQKDWAQHPDAEQFNPLQPLSKQHYTKVDPYPGYMSGTLALIGKKDALLHKSAFYITCERLYFITDDAFIERALDKLAETRQWKTPSTGIALFSVLNELIDDDMEYLEKMEDRLGALEEAVLERQQESIDRSMLDIRKELLRRARCYSQLHGLAQEFEEDENELFDSAVQRQFNLLADRAARRESYCQTLREYCAQIRDVYQAHIDLMQNNTMKVLTVVATIFMPLTLIAGWYGMNFSNMPELEWEYGYPVVILSSLLVTVVSIWWFKKKNIL